MCGVGKDLLDFGPRIGKDGNILHTQFNTGLGNGDVEEILPKLHCDFFPSRGFDALDAFLDVLLHIPYPTLRSWNQTQIAAERGLEHRAHQPVHISLLCVHGGRHILKFAFQLRILRCRQHPLNMLPGRP